MLVEHPKYCSNPTSPCPSSQTRIRSLFGSPEDLVAAPFVLSFMKSVIGPKIHQFTVNTKTVNNPDALKNAQDELDEHVGRESRQQKICSWARNSTSKKNDEIDSSYSSMLFMFFPF
ncbi:hypothetical protein L2E82_29783 [Cichorium intybus]|uniref:Uncharacterized protein n=1 Tax=Cichorium intybus TaxID=13427 RepID=A0ACB9CYH6_CICIN|nr:hypothetical protein L2E82_29783 [Cichorium intybus]